MSAFQPRVPRAVYAISFLILQQSQIAHAAPALIARSENATSGSGLSQPEKITLYVVAAIGGLFALLGVAIYILRSRHQKKYQNHSQRMTRSILKTLPIVQYQYQNGNELPCLSTRTSSIDSCDDLANEKLEKQRNTACPICTDDFIENQMLRILPCDHQYHKACIEDWLSRGSSCPVCRIELKPLGQGRSARDVDTPDVEHAHPRGSDGHAKKLHTRLLRHLYSVGLGQHYNSA